MRKISIISLVAVLAATPMMAKADITPITLLGDTPGTITANTNVASTSYVQGAYNDLAGHINTNAAAINTLNGTGEGSVAAAIVAERTAAATLQSKTIDASSNTISNLQSGNFADGVIATSISSEASNSKLATEKAVADAIAEVNGDASFLADRVEDLESNTSFSSETVSAHSEYLTSTTDLASNVLNIVGAVETLNGDGEGSVSSAVATAKQEAIDASKDYTDSKGVTVYTTWNASTSQVIALDALPD